MAKVPVVVHYSINTGYLDCYIARQPKLLWVDEGTTTADIKRILGREEGYYPSAIYVKDIKFQ